jgi:hypothetical protein
LFPLTPALSCGAREKSLLGAVPSPHRGEGGGKELTKWVEASDNDILSDIYQQTINYVVSGQHASL